MFRLSILTACGLIATGWVMSAANASSGSLSLVRDGKPVATIITAAVPTPAARLAARELRYCIREITGATLPVATDDAKVDGVKILVGEVRDLTPDPLRLNRYEYVIRFQLNTIMLLGRDAKESTGKEIDCMSPEQADLNQRDVDTGVFLSGYYATNFSPEKHSLRP